MKVDMKLWHTYAIFAACIALIAACVLLNISLIYGFAAGILLCCGIFAYKGVRVIELLSMMKKGLGECKILYALILLIGVTVSIWIASGVVPSMIYYGFEYLKEMNFVLAAFLIISISSIFMGTAVGTVSTIGIAILGIGRGLGIPTPILLGAVVSGAFVADKLSPISGLINLTLSTVKTDYKTVIKSMLVTFVPAMLISSVIYYALGVKYSTGLDLTRILELQNSLKEGFYISPWLLLMPLLIVIMSSMGVRIIYSIIAGLSGGAIITAILQRLSFAEIARAIMFGYRAATPSQQLNELLISGGVVSMIEVVLIVMGAIALSSLLEGTGLIERVMSRMIAETNNKGSLIINTGIISSTLTVVTCDQTMGIVLPGRLLRHKFDELKLNRGILARTISDTGTIIAPLMPWNVNALIITVIVGSSIAYQPYAVLCYISPIITFMVGLYYKYREKRVKGKYAGNYS
ncbi:MAG: sodium:proton antiporter [Clostridiales bacterium GWB2_37_7]|nr:MAG: sodium:proton antiporter [Clostridiales bacterium GWB2_37_7]